MNIENKLTTLNEILADYAKKEFAWGKFYEVKSQLEKARIEEVERITGKESEIANKIRESITQNDGGDFKQFLLNALSSEIDALDPLELIKYKGDSREIRISLSTTKELSEETNKLIKEQDYLKQKILDKHAKILQSTDEFKVLKQICDESKFPKIDPFNCVYRTFGWILVSTWGDEIPECAVKVSTVAGEKLVVSLRGRYAGMGETDYLIKFATEENEKNLWNMKLADSGKPLLKFLAA